MHRLLYVPAYLLMALFLLAPPSGADEAEADTVRTLTDDEAASLVKEIKTLAPKREGSALVQLLVTTGAVSHEDLHKPLLGLLKHKSTPVALNALDLLRVQAIEKERDRLKLAKSIWKLGWDARANSRRYGVRGRALRTYAALQDAVVDKGQFREVKGVWQTLIGDPRRKLAPGMIEICRYVRESGDKRLCRMLAEEIDLPQPTDINSPSNPPGEWWQRRYEMWREYNAEAVEALEVLTGETFKTTKDAKDWFEANRREFGFRW